MEGGAMKTEPVGAARGSGLSRDVDARHGGAPRGWPQQRAQHADRRRFPGAVRAEESEDLTGHDCEVDAANRLDLAVALDQLLGRDRRLCHACYPTAAVGSSSLLACCCGLRDRSGTSGMNSEMTSAPAVRMAEIRKTSCRARPRAWRTACIT